MIYVTHDQVEAMTLADRIAIMKGGLIQQLAGPHEIYNRPVNKYVADFIGSPSMNFFEGEVTGDAFRTGDQVIPLDGYQFGAAGNTGGAAWLGFRPEHVVVGPAAAACPYQADVAVEIVEPMGSDTLVWTTLAGQPFRFRLDGQEHVAIGDRLRIGADTARASLFSKDTELRI
jgi:multiple sugar transport system ATP-binding protein